MLSAAQKNDIRKLAKKEFSIPKSTHINVFPVTSNQYMITYLIDRYNHVERREMLILEG